MPTFNNGESAASVRGKINDAIEKVDGTQAISSVDITGGTIDGTVIGGSTPAAGTFTNTELAAIAASKAVTAVDVFVYDTSKDSDGGAWRKRTQGTSWYNETLNTATRGSRREFPAVAVIVAESNKVTIYDGDDPSLPMWMVFSGGSTSDFIRDGVTSVVIRNGLLAIGDGGINGVLITANFISERMEVNFAGVVDVRVWQNIARRNETNDYYSDPTIPDIVNRNVNDVAMTVLPDAPIDPATGLARVTIACATSGGVSVIKDDGTVVDSAETGGTSFVQATENGLWYGRSSLTFYSTYADAQSDGFGDSVSSTFSGRDFDSLVAFQSLVANSNLVYAGGTSTTGNFAVPGLMLHQPNYPDFTKGMSALLTSTYNTGWMNGDIKGAFLSDTDDTDLVGSGELVTNGTFDTDTDWTLDTGFSIAGGVLSYDGSDAGVNGRAIQTVTTIVGETYVVQLDCNSIGGGSFNIRIDSGATTQETFTTAGTKTVTFTAGSTSTSFRIQQNSNANAIEWDNASVKLADADRSVNANGLVINGTITRTFVDEV